MKKNKKTILIISILLCVFLLGYLSSSVIHKTYKLNKYANESEQLIYDYTHSPNSIDSIENISIKYYDSANVEMLHYVLYYNGVDTNSLPNYYVTHFGDTIPYNKEKFFYYAAMYTVAENLLETRRQIINGLLLNDKVKQNKELREKTKE
jgi:hypothetical protein